MPETKEQETALAVPGELPSNRDRIATIEQMRIGSGRQEASNLSATDPRAAILRLSISTNPLVPIGEKCVGQQLLIKAKAIVVTQAELVDQDTGEVKPALRTVFIDPDNVGYYTHSKIVAETALVLLMQPGADRLFKPPLDCVFTMQRLDAKRNGLILSIGEKSLANTFGLK